MEKKFIPRAINDPNVKMESMTIEITKNLVIFFMEKDLVDGRHIYNKTVIDKTEIKEFFEENL